jgi:hypothetical protein
MHRAWGVTEGIGVDVHVRRLANMWRRVGKSKLAATPERTRAALESRLAKELWVGINVLLVAFGRILFLPRGKKCDHCTLARIRMLIARRYLEEYRVLSRRNQWTSKSILNGSMEDHTKARAKRDRGWGWGGGNHTKADDEHL